MVPRRACFLDRSARASPCHRPHPCALPSGAGLALSALAQQLCGSQPRAVRSSRAGAVFCARGSQTSCPHCPLCQEFLCTHVRG